jgi:hypothetical protein
MRCRHIIFNLRRSRLCPCFQSLQVFGHYAILVVDFCRKFQLLDNSGIREAVGELSLLLLMAAGLVALCPLEATVASATTATAQLIIGPAASPGPRAIAVSTGVQTAALTSGFTVATSAPTARPILMRD